MGLGKVIIFTGFSGCRAGAARTEAAVAVVVEGNNMTYNSYFLVKQ